MTKRHTTRPHDESVLIVDDEPWISDVIADQLALEGFVPTAINDSSQAMDLLARDAFDLVILDIYMPAPDGLTLLKRIQAQYPLLPVLMLTAFSDAETATRAMRDGATDYIVKPHHGAQLALRVERALERGEMLRERARAQEYLEQRVAEQTQQLRRQSRQLASMLERMQIHYQATLRALEASLDVRDQSAPGHCRRVAKLAVQLAQEMDVTGDDLVALEHGARLHDIGKMGIPDNILMKPGPLTDPQWEMMRRHPVIGCEIVGHIDFLQSALPIIRHHHEHYDGSGYPDGLRGQEIPLLARIFSVVDAFDALTHNRPYNKVLKVQEALDRLQRDSAKLYDPEVIAAFAQMVHRRMAALSPADSD